MLTIIIKALGETCYMVGVASLFALLFGLPLGIILAYANSLFHCQKIQILLATFSNILRSIPFIILVIALVPLTRLLIGTAIGSSAAIVPLTIGAIPFMARLVENVCLDLPQGLLEVGRSMGASAIQIIRYIILPEALPGLINAFTVTVVTLIAYSAMAGAVGAGGLGDLAIRYGYQRYDLPMTYSTVLVLILLVQSIQLIGNASAKYFKH